MDCTFVGAGSVAEQYAASLDGSDLRLTAVCDLDEGRADGLAGRHEEATAYADLDAMLAAESAPLVVNLTSHAAHAPVTRTCLEADRHVFSEKPLALDAGEAAALVGTARERGRSLACAPENHLADAQRHAHGFLSDDRLGPVRFVSATANVGRVEEWHDRPGSFLDVGPLYDGAVYPLSVLVSWFGRVERVRRADALAVHPGGRPPTTGECEGGADDRSAAPHVEATVEFVDGPVVALRASYYVDHRSREFYGLELHGDGGTLSLDDTGALAADRDAVAVRGGDRRFTNAPHPSPERERPHLAGPERLARTIERGRQTRRSARRSAHVVAVCSAIERAASEGGSVAVDGTVTVPRRLRVTPPARPEPDGSGEAALRLPPVGFGCSRYRDGQYVTPALGAALDAGYRLFDTAELYGNEWRLGALLDGPGGPTREAVFLLGKPWRTNHGPGHLRAACEGSLSELGVDAFDCYALHWPGAWDHRGELRELSRLPVAEQERRTFPTDGGAPVRADHTLLETWGRMEDLYEAGLTRTLGVCNVTLPQLTRLVDAARIPPALVQVERHPYRPRTDLVAWCHRRGIRVVAHSPLSAPGLRSDPVAVAVAAAAGVTPAEVLLAWHVRRGVVPVPSTTTADHASTNLAAARCRLDRTAMDRLDALADPGFER